MVWGYDRIQGAYNTIMAKITRPQYVITFNGTLYSTVFSLRFVCSAVLSFAYN